MFGQTVTLTAANTNYNLLSLILAARGYTVPNLTTAPSLQQDASNQSKFFPNPVRELHYKGDPANGAGIVNITDSSGNICDAVQAGQSNTIRHGFATVVDISMYYVSSTTAAVKLNILVEL